MYAECSWILKFPAVGHQASPTLLPLLLMNTDICTHFWVSQVSCITSYKQYFLACCLTGPKSRRRRLILFFISGQPTTSVLASIPPTRPLAIFFSRDRHMIGHTSDPASDSLAEHPSKFWCLLSLLFFFLREKSFLKRQRVTVLFVPV